MRDTYGLAIFFLCLQITRTDTMPQVLPCHRFPLVTSFRGSYEHFILAT